MPCVRGIALLMACAKLPFRRGTTTSLVTAWGVVPARPAGWRTRTGVPSAHTSIHPHRQQRQQRWWRNRQPQCRRKADVFRCFSTLSKRQNSRPVSTDEVTQAARTRATALVDSFVSIPATEGDLRCIEERQLRHKAGTTAGVSPPCRHGFPQAFGFDPCGYKTSSGLFRLSCPLLVQAIDSLEDEGGIEHMNARLDVEEDLREDFMAVNVAHGQLRRRLVTADKIQKVQGIMGKDSAERFLDSGITGVTPSKVRNAKCLHAHVADVLMRGSGANEIGRATLELLEKRGVAISGGERCSEQCNYRVEETPDSWRYTPQKNKQRLQTQKQRRRSMKQNVNRSSEEGDGVAQSMGGVSNARGGGVENGKSSEMSSAEREEKGIKGSELNSTGGSSASFSGGADATPR